MTRHAGFSDLRVATLFSALRFPQGLALPLLEQIANGTPKSFLKNSPSFQPSDLPEPCRSTKTPSLAWFQAKSISFATADYFYCSMTKIFSTLTASFLVMLAGCAISPSAADLIRQRDAQNRARIEKLETTGIESLNIYQDNRVAIKYVAKNPNDNVWRYVYDPKIVIAFAASEKYINARDVLKITKDYSNQSFQIHLRNGGSLVVPLDHFMIQAFSQDRQKKGIIDYFLERDLKTNSDVSADINAALNYGDLWKSSILEAEIYGEQKYDELISLRKVKEERFAAAKKEKEQNIREAAVREREHQYRMQEALRIETEEMRKNIRIGSRTNCGEIFDVRLPMVGVQTINGIQYIRLADLYGPSQNCRFANGKYVGK